MSRVAARVFAWLSALIGLTMLFVGPAYGEEGDVISDFRIDYLIQADGTVRVVEDIDYEFGGSQERHGIYRQLITRQPFAPGSDQDVTYDISDIEVTSANAPDNVDRSTHWRGFRTQYIELKIGDEDRTLTSRQATYRISYTVKGALRTIDGQPEFYWNATGTDWKAEIAHVRVLVRAPQGAGELNCYWGAAGDTEKTCTTGTEDGAAVFEHSGLGVGEGMTVSALLPAGSVSNATPTVVPKGSLIASAHLNPLTIGGSLLACLAALLLAVRSHRAMRDERFAGTPPGVIAPQGTPAIQDTIDEDAIPVRFNAPDIPPELGGPLESSSASSRRTAAVLIELATQGAVGVVSTPDSGRKFKDSGGLRRAVHPRDLSRAQPGYQTEFVQKLFGPAGTPVVIDHPDTNDKKRFAEADKALTKALDAEAKKRGWTTGSSVGLGCGLFMLIVFGIIALVALASSRGAGIWLYAVPGLVVAGGLGYAGVRWMNGHRTPVGRALTDQVVGFKRYLTTAEAGQLRFEEGEDIFSKFLPWAIVFDVAERWQKICSELAAAGRIPDTPGWYAGPSFYSSYSSTDFGTSFASASVSNSSSSGSGGGGSSGGGGGGGGGGSW